MSAGLFCFDSPNVLQSIDIALAFVAAVLGLSNQSYVSKVQSLKYSRAHLILAGSNDGRRDNAETLTLPLY